MLLGLSWMVGGWMDGWIFYCDNWKKSSICSTTSSSRLDWTKMNSKTEIKLNHKYWKKKQCWSDFVIDKWSGGRYGAKTPQQLGLSTAEEGVHKQHFKFWSRTCQTFAYQMFVALDKWSPASLAEDVKWILLNHDGRSVCCQQGKSLRSGPSPHQPTN